MTTTSTAVDRADATASLPAEALVLGTDGDRVRVRLVTTGETPKPPARPREAHELRARVAVPGYLPAEGDRVLVQRVAEGGVYILGVVHAFHVEALPQAPPPAPPGASVATPSGASASVEGDRIALRDAAGRLLLTLDGATGELRLEAQKDLRLSAPEGRVVVEAGALDLSVGHYELRAQRIIERTTDAFRTAEGILETRARHARLLVSRTLELFGRRTTISSEEDTRIDGKRVLLG
jgi:hypothetical protein